jgi:hypothetical protein
MKGRLISVCSTVESSILAFSAASFRRCKACGPSQVDALILAELVGDVVDDALVPVIAAQEGVAIGRRTSTTPIANVQDRDVKRAAAQVIDGIVSSTFLSSP